MSKTRALLERHPNTCGIALALVGSICFSGKAIVIKLAYAYPVDPSTLLAMRMLLSFPFFLAALIWSMLRTKQTVPISLKDYRLIVLAGLTGYYLASLFDFMGLQYITVGLERLILFTYPSMVLIMGCLIRSQLPQQSQLLLMGISYLGLAVVYGHESVLVAENTSLGSILVFVSAICYSTYMLIGERLLKKLGTIRVTCMASLVSAAAILTQINIQQPFSIIMNQPAGVWGWSAVNAVFGTFIPVFAVMTAISLIGAPRVAQIGMIGPVSTILLGTVILHEPFTIWHALGTGLVIMGVAALNLKKSRTNGMDTLFQNGIKVPK